MAVGRSFERHQGRLAFWLGRTTNKRKKKPTLGVAGDFLTGKVVGPCAILADIKVIVNLATLLEAELRPSGGKGRGGDDRRT